MVSHLIDCPFVSSRCFLFYRVLTQSAISALAILYQLLKFEVNVCCKKQEVVWFRI